MNYDRPSSFLNLPHKAGFLGGEPRFLKDRNRGEGRTLPDRHGILVQLGYFLNLLEGGRRVRESEVCEQSFHVWNSQAQKKGGLGGGWKKHIGLSTQKCLPKESPTLRS